MNMCDQTTCKWFDDFSADLYPIDAGTDDGISYLSQNNPRQKQEPVHIIEPDKIGCIGSASKF